MYITSHSVIQRILWPEKLKYFRKFTFKDQNSGFAQ